MKTNKEVRKYEFLSLFKNVFLHKIIFVFIAFLLFSNTAFALETTGTPVVEENKVSVLVKKALLEGINIKYKVYKLDSSGKKSSTNSVLSGDQNLIAAESPLTPTTFEVIITGVEQLVRNSSYQIEFEINETGLSPKTNTAVATFKTVSTDSRVANPGSGASSTGSTKGVCDIDKAGFYPYGNTNDGFYKESNKPTISIVIQTINCAGQQLKLTVKELDRCIGSFIPGQNCNDKLTSSDLDNKTITIPSTGNLTLNYTAGEENCETLTSTVGLRGYIDIADGYDCLYYFELVKPDGSKWSSMDRAGGAISYECDGVCRTDWELKSQEEDTVEVGAKDSRIATDEYTLLAPIGEIKSIGEGRTLGDYINLIVTIFLGICGALAVIMIIIYGLQWMGTDSVFGKTEAKQNIGGALMGLVLALGSWMLLNTINPDLLGGELFIGQASIKLTEDEVYFEQTEGKGKDYPGYTVAGGNSSTPSPSAGVLDFEKKLKDGYAINSINIYTNDRAAFVATKNGSANASVTIDIGHGFGGFSEVGKPEKTKTPKGTFQVGASNTRMEISQSDKKAIMTLNGKYNLGAAFIGFNALDEKGANRGIGFHGRWNNSLSTTNGCIRMKNDDLLILAPYMKRDKPRVTIQ